MRTLLALHGASGITLLCLLLLVEEAGVPIPILTGEAILLVAGILVANDSIPLWLFLPFACLSVLAGACIGYAWTRKIGATGLVALARRLHLEGALEKVRARLATAGPGGIAACRLIPGMRINTTLVAGAMRIDVRTFVLGIIPPIALWVTGFTLLGLLVGVPAQRILGRADKVATDGVILLLVAVGGYFALRHIPAVARGDNALTLAPKRGRLALALLVDLALVSCLVLGVAGLVRMGIGIGDVDGFVDFLVIVVACVLGYALVARRGVGLTGGEALVGVRYRHGVEDDDDGAGDPSAPTLE